ncbi:MULTISPECIES: hypothetical protein [unclassified Pseudomonas]|uniref:hypothetical protein n=1 Tax=unclassified Pseudomonas TaxID=196821 RepID=UPI000A1F4CEB|nr:MULTISPECIES: hypothetical protein [unclassified Pseudomonas]
MKNVILLSISLFFPAYASAEWQQSSVTDEMREKTTAVFTQVAKPIDGKGPSVEISVIDNADGRPGAVIFLDGGVPDNCPVKDSAYCEINVKLGSGAVEKMRFTPADKSRLIPQKSTAFVGSLKLASTMYVEIDIKNVGPRQYKFQTGGLPVAVDRSPNLTVHGFDLGQEYKGDKPGLTQLRVNGSDICYQVSDGGDSLGNGRFQDARLCFFEDVFYQAILSKGESGSYEAGKKYLISVFGKPDTDSVYPSWPNDGDKVIVKSTKRASYMPGLKKSDGLFLIYDDIVSSLVPSAVSK